MAKRADRGHDATQEVSASQLLRDVPIAPARPKGGAVNDVSMWAHKVVGTDEFAPAQPRRAERSRGWLIAAVLGAAVIAGGGVAYWSVRDSASDESASATRAVSPDPAIGSATAAAGSAPAPTVAAGSASAPAVAAGSASAPMVAAGSAEKPVPAVADAGPADAPDAISSAAAVVAPSKAAPARKPVTKTAAAPAKKPVAKKSVTKKPAPPPPKRRTR